MEEDYRLMQMPLTFHCTKYGLFLTWNELEKRSCVGVPTSSEACQSLSTFWDPIPEEVDA
jgi:hypothetical protein